MIVNPLASAFNTFTAFAAVAGLSPLNTIAMRPSKMNKGAPGGWGNCTLKQLETNSPQSQKLPAFSAVSIYTSDAIKQMTQPVTLFTFLKFIQ